MDDQPTRRSHRYEPGSTSRRALSPPAPDQLTVISSKQPAALPAAVPGPTRPLDLARTLLGEQLGHYRLEEFVGGGGMGAVFRATDLELGRTVAVKVVPCETSDEETIRRFKNEAQSAARLDHARIARVFYVGADKGWHYIVFEFIEGINIRDLVEQEGPLPLADVVLFTRQVAEALGHAWEREVVHRDIKPSNVLVMEDGSIKLVDMGLARLHQESSADDLTASGMTLGTFDYISPEQARDPRATDVRSDLYSLGCTIYFMLTGRPPFPEGTVLQKLLRHSSDQPVDVDSLRTDTPEALAEVVHRLLAKLPSDRYQTPADLIAALDAVGVELGLAPSNPALPPAPRPRVAPARLDALMPALGWGAMLLALGGISWLLGADGAGDLVMAPPVLLEPAKSVAAPIAEPTPDVETSPESADNRAPTDVAVGDSGDAESPGAARGGAEQGASETRGPGPATPVGPTLPEGVGERPATGDSSPNRPTEGASAGATGAATTQPGDSTSTGGATTPQTAATPGVSPMPSAEGTPAVEPAPPTPMTTVAPRTVAIVSPGVAVPEGMAAAGTLAEAFTLIEQHAEVTTLELHTDEPLVTTEPLRLPDGRSLTITAGPGHSPMCVFRPAADSQPAARRMVRLTGGTLRVVGVDWRLELPEGYTEGWALFNLQLRGVPRLELEDSTLTIVNHSEQVAIPHAEVAFLNLEGHAAEAMPARRPPGGGSGLTSTQILLDDVVARGEATLIRSEVVEPFAFSWTRGFLATNQRLLEVGGSYSAEGMMKNAAITLNLQRVTVVADQGLVLVAPKPTEELVGLTLSLDQCAIEIGSASPLIEHSGVESRDRAMRMTQVLCTQNQIGPTDQIWRIMPRQGALEDTPLSPSELRVTGTPQWRTPDNELPHHQRDPSQYRLSDEPPSVGYQSGR